MDWSTLKRAFFVCIAIYFAFKILIMMALSSPGANRYTLLNLEGFIDLVGLLGIVLGLILLGRWISTKGNQFFASRIEHLHNGLKENLHRSPKEQITPQNTNLTGRWDALVKYDDDICKAAEQLRPFGEFWVNELAQAFFALNEDRQYLSNIVSRLKERAEQEKADKLRQQWENRFRYTACGELCTSESLNILREAERGGYILGVEKGGTFTVTKNGRGTTFLRSNGDILRFANFDQSKKEEFPECDLKPLPGRQGPHDYKGFPYYFYPNDDVVDGFIQRFIQREWWRMSFNEFKSHVRFSN